MINTEKVSELRPPKKPTDMGKHYRKVDVVMVNKFCRDSKRHFLIHYISDVASYN